MKPISRDDERKFPKFVKEDSHFCKYYDGIYILFNTGLRISEFVGLTFNDLDFDNMKINVDMTGLQCLLKMASKRKDFDYDRFFVKYAQRNRNLSLYSFEYGILMLDPHPLYYARTNIAVQQFEEFYETYGVKEGGNMYLAPEDSLIVW